MAFALRRQASRTSSRGSSEFTGPIEDLTGLASAQVTVRGGEAADVIPCRDAVQHSKDAPLVLVPSPRAPQQEVHKGLSAEGHVAVVNTGLPVSFDTPLFSGKVWVYIRGLHDTPKDMFEGRQRQFWFVVQGKFKREVAANKLVVGNEFTQRLNLPGGWLVAQVVRWLMRRLGGSMDIQPHGSRPYLYAPWVAHAQVVNVSEEGHEPVPLEATDDLRLLGNKFSDKNGAPLPVSARRALMRRAAERADVVFDPRYVYTVHSYEAHINLPKYSLTGIVPLNLVNILNGQPIQFMIRDLESGDYLMNFEVWHERLLALVHSRQRAAAGKALQGHALEDD